MMEKRNEISRVREFSLCLDTLKPQMIIPLIISPAKSARFIVAQRKIIGPRSIRDLFRNFCPQKHQVKPKTQSLRNNRAVPGGSSS